MHSGGLVVIIQHAIALAVAIAMINVMFVISYDYPAAVAVLMHYATDAMARQCAADAY